MCIALCVKQRIAELLVCFEEVTDERTQGPELVFHLLIGIKAPEIIGLVRFVVAIHMLSVVAQSPVSMQIAVWTPRSAGSMELELCHRPLSGLLKYA
jgi:hypothetical protein